MTYFVLAGLGNVSSLENQLQTLRNQLVLAKNQVSMVKNTPASWTYKRTVWRKQVTTTANSTYGQVVGMKPAPKSVFAYGSATSPPQAIYNQAKSAITNAQGAVKNIEEQVKATEDLLIAAKQAEAESKAAAAAKEKSDAAFAAVAPIQTQTIKMSPGPDIKPAPTPAPAAIPAPAPAQVDYAALVRRLTHPQNTMQPAAQPITQQATQQATQRAIGPQPTRKPPMSTGKKVAIGGGVAAAALLFLAS